MKMGTLRLFKYTDNRKNTIKVIYSCISALNHNLNDKQF